MLSKQYVLILLILLGLIGCNVVTPVSAYSDDAVRWYNEGNVLISAGNNTQAIEAFDHAIALEPAYFEAYDRKADALNRDGQLTEALAASKKALEINPEYAPGWINQGQVLYNIGYYYEDTLGNPEKADEYYIEQLLAFEKATVLEPGNADAWFNLGYALAGMKRYDEALAAFDTVESLDPEYPNLALSQKQATVLRDAATPAYVKYAVPLVAGILIVFIIIGLWFMLRKGAEPADEEDSSRRSRRRTKKKKEE
jgi:tetratricopeptide (TPR) repeat protein